eukprot:SAG31_NODE_1532_length_7990_cov_8.692941_1_plen_55_part_00
MVTKGRWTTLVFQMSPRLESLHGFDAFVAKIYTSILLVSKTIIFTTALGDATTA